MSDKMNGKNFLVGAVVGGVLGAVTALLLAPKSGKELRSDISEQYGKVSDKTVEIAEAVSSKTQEIAKTVSSQTGEWIGKAKEAAGTVVSEVKAWRDGRKEAEASLEALDQEEAVERAVAQQEPVLAGAGEGNKN